MMRLRPAWRPSIRQYPESASRASCCRPVRAAPFGRHFRQRSHLEVRGSHPCLDGPEWMLHGLAAHAHLVRVAVEPVLHRLENGLVLPPRDPALLAGRTLSLKRARLTSRRPVAALLVRV